MKIKPIIVHACMSVHTVCTKFIALLSTVSQYEQSSSVSKLWTLDLT